MKNNIHNYLKYKIFVSGAAETSKCPENSLFKGKEIGREVARRKIVLMNGATTGFPLWAAIGAKEENGFVVGISPASNIKEHIELLRLTMGSRDVSVRIHGSAGLGVAGPSSDIDLFILVGEKDQYEDRYQALMSQYEDEHRTQSELHGAEYRARFEDRPDLAEEERIHEFFEKSGVKLENQRKLGPDGMRMDAIFLRIPELVKGLERISAKLIKGEELGGNPDFWNFYNTAFVFGSRPIFEAEEGVDAKLRNSILTTILTSESGKILWNIIRSMFEKYFVDYENNITTSDPYYKNINPNKVKRAFQEILTKEGIPEEKQERTKSFMRQKRKQIQLPTFEDLQKIKSQVLSTTLREL